MVVVFASGLLVLSISSLFYMMDFFRTSVGVGVFGMALLLLSACMFGIRLIEIVIK